MMHSPYSLMISLRLSADLTMGSRKSKSLEIGLLDLWF